MLVVSTCALSATDVALKRKNGPGRTKREQPGLQWLGIGSTGFCNSLGQSQGLVFYGLVPAAMYRPSLFICFPPAGDRLVIILTSELYWLIVEAGGRKLFPVFCRTTAR